jgi:uncharacterized DUF497 family protein
MGGGDRRCFHWDWILDGISYMWFIEREDNMIRIISARKATRQEKAQYED